MQGLATGISSDFSYQDTGPKTQIKQSRVKIATTARYQTLRQNSSLVPDDPLSEYHF